MRDMAQANRQEKVHEDMRYVARRGDLNVHMPTLVNALERGLVYLL
jgi:hypothetical protein